MTALQECADFLEATRRQREEGRVPSAVVGGGGGNLGLAEWLPGWRSRVVPQPWNNGSSVSRGRHRGTAGPSKGRYRDGLTGTGCKDSLGTCLCLFVFKLELDLRGCCLVARCLAVFSV